MKKTILPLIIACMATQLLSAQNPEAENRLCWIDFQIGQHIGLNDWSTAGYVNDGMPSTSITELRGVGNVYLANEVFGLFADMGIGIMPAPGMKSFSPDHMPMPNSGTQYYLREMLSESGSDNVSAHFKIAAGVFFNFPATDKLNIMPYLGYGGIVMSRRSYEMILKEQGSNMQYNTSYSWGSSGDSSTESGSDMLGYFSARLNFNHKISPKLSLLFGLEYTHFLKAFNFYGRYTNTFNGNVQREIMVKGKKMNMLGITAGISFR